MTHNHNHSCTCAHASVKYCSHCKTVFCEGCNQEWTTKSAQTFPWHYYYNGYNTVGSAGLGQVTYTSDTTSAIPLTHALECKHGA